MTRSTPRFALTAILSAIAIIAITMVQPVAAASYCVADAADDVREQAQPRDIVDDPRVDLLAVCVDYDATRLRVTVRVDQPTDPFSSALWDGQAGDQIGDTAIGMVIDTNNNTDPRDGAPGGEEFLTNLARFPQEGGGFEPPRVKTFVAGTANTLATDDGQPCNNTASFDGTTYVLTVPSGCLNDAAQIQLAVYMYLESDAAANEDVGLYDEIPMAPAYLAPLRTTPDTDTQVDRLRGPSRVETALAVSQADFGEGSAGAVVLARADAAPDALSAAPLAVAVDGPVLLTARDALPPLVEAEIQRILPDGGRILLSGGQAAISSGVEDTLRGLGYEVVRAAGATRYATSVEVARATDDDPDLIVVANGNDFPDALIGGALAGAEGGVQILSNGSMLDATAAAYLDEHPDADVVAIGEVAAQAVPDADGITGDDPFATSVEVADRYGNVNGVAIASGVNFPDGLAGGAHAGRAGIPLLLSWPDLLPESVSDYLDSESPLGQVVLYGGTAALSAQIERDAAAALG